MSSFVYHMTTPQFLGLLKKKCNFHRFFFLEQDAEIIEYELYESLPSGLNVLLVFSCLSSSSTFLLFSAYRVFISYSRYCTNLLSIVYLAIIE